MKKRTYNFTNKDPVCDELGNLVDAAGLRGRKNIGKIAMLATVAYGTVDGILYGETKKPRHDTVMAIGTAMGFERRWVASSAKSWNLEEELEKARAFIKKQRELMAQEAKGKPKKKTTTRKRAKTQLKLVASR
jgi:hypothetical protein